MHLDGRGRNSSVDGDSEVGKLLDNGMQHFGFRKLIVANHTHVSWTPNAKT